MTTATIDAGMIFEGTWCSAQQLRCIYQFRSEIHQQPGAVETILEKLSFSPLFHCTRDVICKVMASVWNLRSEVTNTCSNVDFLEPCAQMFGASFDL